MQYKAVPYVSSYFAGSFIWVLFLSLYNLLGSISARSECVKLTINAKDLRKVEATFIQGRQMTMDIKDLQEHQFFKVVNLIAIRNTQTK